MTSNAAIRADHIKFTTFDWTVTNPTTNKTIFHLDSNGNLTIAGKFHGEFDDTVIVGSGNYKMYIRPKSSGAELVGVDTDNNDEVLTLGFQTSSGGYVFPSLDMHGRVGGLYGSISINSTGIWVNGEAGSVQIAANNPNANGIFFGISAWNQYGHIGVKDYKFIIEGTWPSYSNINSTSHAKGVVYADDNGFLKIKNWEGVKS